VGWLTPTEFVLGSIEPYGTPRDLTRVNLISAEAGAIFLSQAGGQTSAPGSPWRVTAFSTEVGSPDLGG